MAAMTELKQQTETLEKELDTLRDKVRELQYEVKTLQTTVGELQKKITTAEEGMVLKSDFIQIKNIVYGALAVIAGTFFKALVDNYIKKG